MPAMSWKGVQSCKIGRIIFRAVTYLLITILGVSYSSAHAQTLTPDLVFSTYLGGAAGSNPLTFAQNDACDALGNIYVTGATQVSNLPVPNAYQPTPAPGSTESAFVAKYNEAGQLLWCTYLGGNNQSMGIGVAAMPNGGVVVVGITTSNASGSFPTLNAFQSQNNGQSDYFVSVFNANGKLQYSTYLGGSGVEGAVGGTPGQIIFTDDSNPGNCVAVDANGLIYVSGITTSSNLPVTANAQQSNLAGTTNACLFIIDPSKSGAASLVYSSFLGGDRDSQGHSVAVDPSGRYISVAGFTTSSNFPTTTNAYRSTAPPGGFSTGSSNGFVTEFQSSQPGSPSSQYTMRYSTYLGGDSSTARDDVYGMTMEPSGLIVATGRTQSAGFPMTKGGPTIFNCAPYLKEGVSGDEPFLVKINPSLSGTASLVYSTFLGGGSASGKWGSWSTSVAVDARGAVYVAGETGLNTPGEPVPSTLTAPKKFPYTPNAFQKAPQGSEDAFLMEINPSGDYLGYSTYLGGTFSDRTYGLAVDPDGNVVMTGLTFSSNFPLQNPAQTYPGNYPYQNAFVTEFSPLYTPVNLIIDNGATYTVTGNIIYDNEYIGQNSTGTLIQGGFTNTVNNNLELGQNAGASGTYNLSDGSLSVAGNEYIGYSGSGSFTQSGGTNTVTGILILAANAGSSGTYSLSGGSLTVGDYEAVGYCGTGSFTQSGGTHTVTALYLGAEAGASGSYTLSDSGSGSLLSVVGNEYIGENGSGAFTQSGGTNTTMSLTLGDQTGSSGTYTLSGAGSLSVSGNETIGNYGSGAFTQTGGSNTLDAPSAAGGELWVGTQGGSGAYSLSGGSLSTNAGICIGASGGNGTFSQTGGSLQVTAGESIGDGGSGSFSQSGGANNASGLALGTDFVTGSAGTGAYNLSGGSLQVGYLGEYIGADGGSGSFSQSGGSHTISGELYLGANGGTGTYNLSGGSLSNGEEYEEYIGDGGSGSFSQSGGSNTTSIFIMGDGGTGTYSLSGGSLAVSGVEYIGTLGGTGAFTQSGGTNTVSGNLYLGVYAPSTGTYTLSGGSLTAVNEYVGDAGTGTFSQSGGTNTVTGTLFLGYNPGASGTYNLSGGSLLVAASEYVGDYGTGAFTQSGGSHTVARNLSLGNYDGGIGTYTLSGGSLAVIGEEYLGSDGGSGTFIQSGGSHTVSGNLFLGISGGSGTYSLSGGSLAVSGYEYLEGGSFTQSGGSNAADIVIRGIGSTVTFTLTGGSLASGAEYIGTGGLGIFNQSGGANIVSGLSLGTDAVTGIAGTGAYNLSGGSLQVDYSETIGVDSGSGTFTQSGGSHTISGNLYLGENGGTGTYGLSRGSLSVGGEEYIGDGGLGSFNQCGGTHIVNGALELAAADVNSSGTYTLSGGSLSVGASEYIGDFGSGAFTQSGGSHTVSSGLYVGYSSGTGTYTLSGGSLSVSGGEYIGVSGTGDFIQSGGSNTVTGGITLGPGSSGTYTLSGGCLTADSITGNLVNGGTFTTAFPTLTPITGNYTQNASGTLRLQIASASNYAILGVGGVASLNGTVAPVLLGGYIPAVNQVFPGVITATGGVTGAFSSVANSTPILAWQVIDPAGTVTLLSKRNYAGTGLDLTRNQFNVGAMLNGIQGAATGDLGNVLNTIAALPSNSEVASAYQQISPEKAAALSTLAFAGANLQKSTLSRRITDLRFGPQDAGLTAGGLGAFNLNYAQGSGLMVASSASSLTGLLSGQQDPGALEKPWGVYFDPGLILGGQGSTLDQTGFDFTMAGFTAGTDYRVWQDLLVGLNTGYTYTSAGFRGSGGYVHGNTWPLNAYAAYLPKPFYAYGSLGYALNLYNLERDINFGGLGRAAESSTTGNQLNAYGETGYDLKFNPVVLTPAVNLSYSKLWLDGFTESGAGALNLTVGPQNAQSLQTGVGGKIAVPLQRDGVTVTPQAYAFYQHEYSDSSRTLDARLSQTGSAFSYLTDSFTGAPHRNFAVLGADITIATKKNLKVQLDYNAEVGRGNYTAHYISAGVRWEF